MMKLIVGYISLVIFIGDKVKARSKFLSYGTSVYYTILCKCSNVSPKQYIPDKDSPKQYIPYKDAYSQQINNVQLKQGFRI